MADPSATNRTADTTEQPCPPIGNEFTRWSELFDDLERLLMVFAMSVNERAAPPSGDPATSVVAFERAHGQALFGFARRLGVSEGQAADVTQEALLRLFEALSRGEAIRDPRAWTFHVAYRLAVDDHRRAARSLRLVGRLGAEPGTSRDISDEQREIRGEVWSAVDRLPERQREVLYLRFRADLDFDTIGTVLGITASAARSHCTQALSRLRSRLSGEVTR